MSSDLGKRDLRRTKSAINHISGHDNDFRDGTSRQAENKILNNSTEIYIQPIVRRLGINQLDPKPKLLQPHNRGSDSLINLNAKITTQRRKWCTLYTSE
jgi:hypothetical protein